jgi:hypothetical protein
VQGMYCSLRELRNASDKPPARAARQFLGSDVASVQLRAEKVDPEIPVHRDPQEAFADADERGRQRDRVRREVVQLHAVVVTQSPHEAARRRRETALVEADEADDVVERWVGHSVPLRRLDPFRGLPVHIRRQLAAGHQHIQRQRRKSKNSSGAEAREARMANAKCEGKKPPHLPLLDL